MVKCERPFYIWISKEKTYESKEVSLVGNNTKKIQGLWKMSSRFLNLIIKLSPLSGDGKKVFQGV